MGPLDIQVVQVLALHLFLYRSLPFNLSLSLSLSHTRSLTHIHTHFLSPQGHTLHVGFRSPQISNIDRLLHRKKITGLNRSKLMYI